jgi:hypothetical protein
MIPISKIVQDYNVKVSLVRVIHVPENLLKIWSLEHNANFMISTIMENLGSGEIKFVGYKMTRQGKVIGKREVEFNSSPYAIKEFKDAY